MPKSIPAYSRPTASRTRPSGGPRLGPDGPLRVGQEALVFGPIGRIGRHVGGEVVDLPVARHRRVQRIERAVDRHRAILAHAAVPVAQIDVLDEQHIVAGKGGDRGGELAGLLDAHEMFAGVETRRAREHRERHAVPGDDRSAGCAQLVARHRCHTRRNDAPNGSQPVRVCSPRGGEHAGRRVDHRARGADQPLLE